MSSRFYRMAGEESGDESEKDTEEVEEVPQPPKPVSYNKFSITADDSDDDSDEEKRVVVPTKDRKLTAMHATAKLIRNHLKIGAWVAVLKEWENLDKQLAALPPTTLRAGIPPIYFQQLLHLDNIIKNTGKEARKKMKSDSAKAMARVASKIKKVITKYTKQIEEYKKNPLPEQKEEEAKAAKSDDDEDDEEEEDDDEDEKVESKKPAAKPAPAKKKDESEDEEDEDEEDDKPAKKPAKKAESDDDDDDETDNKKGDDGDDDDDDEEWDVDDDDDDEKGEAIDLNKGVGKWFTREYWVKKPGYNSDDEDKPTRKKVKKSSARAAQIRTQGRPDPVAPTKPVALVDEKKKKEDEVFTPESVLKKLNELVSMRGKRGTDRQAMINDLKLLSTKATTPGPLLKVLITLCSALFDVTSYTDAPMSTTLWNQAYETITAMVKLLNSNPLVRLSEDDLKEESFEMGENEEQKVIEQYITRSASQVEEEKKAKAEEENKLKEKGQEIQWVEGNLYSFVDRMANEFKKSLQSLPDLHTPDYLTRYRDETALLSLIDQVAEYYSKINKTSFLCKVFLLKLEHIYYQHNPAFDAQAKKDAKEDGKERKEEKKEFSLDRRPVQTFFPTTTISSPVQDIALFLYKNADQRTRMRALLCHVYFYAIHNHYNEARDLLMMSHIQDSVNELDVSTRILYNRTIAQLGLCAFRVGEYRQSLNCLTDLYQNNARLKELLAQGITQHRYQDRGDVELDKRQRMEKRRQYPFHMHISTDMLEAVHLLSAMFAEVPNVAIYGLDNRKRMISKSFRKCLTDHLRHPFNGPPENTRDLVMAATKALQKGDWQKCLQHINKLKMWEFMHNTESVKTLITNKVKEEALRTYLFTYATQYLTVSLTTLTDMFELSEQAVFRITSKMMVNDQLQGSWDQPSKCIVMHAQDPTPLQRAAIKYAEKAALFLEQNERTAEQLRQPSGGFGHARPNQPKQGQKWGLRRGPERAIQRTGFSSTGVADDDQ